jgi:hypothetical protein
MSLIVCAASACPTCLINASTQALGGGRKTSGYFASDLTLKQIKTLWAIQSFPERDQSVGRKYRFVQLRLGMCAGLAWRA